MNKHSLVCPRLVSAGVNHSAQHLLLVRSRAFAGAYFSLSSEHLSVAGLNTWGSRSAAKTSVTSSSSLFVSQTESSEFGLISGRAPLRAGHNRLLGGMKRAWLGSFRESVSLLLRKQHDCRLIMRLAGDILSSSLVPWGGTIFSLYGLFGPSQIWASVQISIRCCWSLRSSYLSSQLFHSFHITCV